MCIRQRNVTPIMFSDEDLLLLQAAAMETLTTTETILEMIVCGDLIGEELLDWLIEKQQQQGLRMPSVSDIVECLVDENDPGCSWALPTAQGAVLLHLTIDDEDAQLDILETMQQYCHEVDFPVADSGDYLIQEMFRSVFGWGLVSPKVVRRWVHEAEDSSSRYSKTIALEQTHQFCRTVSTLFTSNEDIESFLSSIVEENCEDEEKGGGKDDDYEIEGEEHRFTTLLEAGGLMDSIRLTRGRTFAFDDDDEEEYSQEIESLDCTGLLSMDDSMSFHHVRLFGEPSS